MTATFDYWREAGMNLLEELGFFDAASKDDFDRAGDLLEGWAENQSMAFGHHCIPNPKDAEIAEVKRTHAREMKEANADIARLKENVGRRYGIDPQRISVGDGRIFYSDGRTTEIHDG